MRASCCTKLDGTWVPVAANVPDSSCRSLNCGSRLADHRKRIPNRIVDRTSQVVDCGELRLDEAVVPCALDIIGLEGPNAGRRMFAPSSSSMAIGSASATTSSSNNARAPMRPVEGQLAAVDHLRALARQRGGRMIARDLRTARCSTRRTAIATSAIATSAIATSAHCGGRAGGPMPDVALCRNAGDDGFHQAAAHRHDQWRQPANSRPIAARFFSMLSRETAEAPETATGAAARAHTGARRQRCR